jgi:hypothetical protein
VLKSSLLSSSSICLGMSTITTRGTPECVKNARTSTSKWGGVHTHTPRHGMRRHAQPRDFSRLDWSVGGRRAGVRTYSCLVHGIGWVPYDHNERQLLQLPVFLDTTSIRSLFSVGGWTALGGGLERSCRMAVARHDVVALGPWSVRRALSSLLVTRGSRAPWLEVLEVLARCGGWVRAHGP